MHKAIRIQGFTVEKIRKKKNLLQKIVSFFSRKKQTSFYYKIFMMLGEPVGVNYLLLLPSGVKLEVVWTLNSTVEARTIREYAQGTLENYNPEVCFVITKRWIKQ